MTRKMTNPEREETPTAVAVPSALPALSPDEVLDTIALGEISSSVAGTLLRQLMVPTLQTSGDEIFEALRSVAWKLFAERLSGEAMSGWHDLFQQASALFTHHESQGLASKTDALVELALESVRFGESNGFGAILAKAHVMDILQSLAKHKGAVPKGELVEDTKLKQANLSRILANMGAAGLVERHHSGRTVVVSLTSAGREALASPPRNRPSVLVTLPPITSEAVDPVAQSRR